MRTPSKKRSPSEMEPVKDKAPEMKETPEEEVREGTESEEGEEYPKKSRKRSAKGAKNTKAPMDAECGCSEKGRKGKCDGSCGKAMKDGGNYPMKRRTDALTAPEYLAACDLGIQGRSRSYIRARLDAAERLDLKCGKGAISKGEKCHKGPAVKTEVGMTKSGRIKTGWQARKQTWGERFGDDLKNNFGYSIKSTAKVGAVVGGISGLAAGGPVGAVGGALAGSAVGGALGAVSAPLGSAISATVGHPTSVLERKKSKKRRDSVYAPGFSVDYDQLAL